MRARIQTIPTGAGGGGVGGGGGGGGEVGGGDGCTSLRLYQSFKQFEFIFNSKIYCRDWSSS